MKIKFLGAAGTVTGSRTLLTHKGHRWMVDCGLFQGPKDIRQRNWEPFSEADKVEAILLTHAHIDHSGYLPKMAREGFRGPIYCSEATADLCRIMLMDSAHLQEEDAKFANRSKHSHHDPALPLYSTEDAEQAIELLKPVAMDQWHELGEGVGFRLLRSGHILGSSFVQISFEVENGSKLITFSGDVGNGRSHVLKPPVNISESHYLVLESTYGDRNQPREDIEGKLAELIHRVCDRKGVLVIPAFTVGRTQELLYLIRHLEDSGKIAKIPVYVDSPMALDATQLYLRYSGQLKSVLRNGEFHPPLSTSSYRPVRSTDESMLLCMKEGPMVVISAAGMLTGGRILHHLKARLPDPRHVVLFVGYQAEGTKGQLLKNGLRRIRIHHQDIHIEADIESVDSLSAHADSDDLIDWLGHFQKPPETVFLNHGESSALNAFCYRIRSELGHRVVIPGPGDEFELK